MKNRFISILLTSLILMPTSGAFAQSNTDAAQRADNLRLKLIDVQSKEAELQERVTQLDEDIKPENIERSLAGIGSTHPEELRETRRRQLQIEKDSVITQLGLLAKNRTALEAEIAAADAEAYQQSARGSSALDQLVLTRFSPFPKLVTILILALLPALGVAGLVLVIRRRQRSQ